MGKLGSCPNLMVDIELYQHYGDDYWAQAKYLVHGIDDVLWTNDIDAALSFLRESLEMAEKEAE